MIKEINKTKISEMSVEQIKELEDKLEQAHLDEEKAMHVRIMRKLEKDPKPLSVDSQVVIEEQLNENLLSDQSKSSLRYDPCLSYGSGIVTYYRM